MVREMSAVAALSRLAPEAADRFAAEALQLEALARREMDAWRSEIATLLIAILAPRTANAALGSGALVHLSGSREAGTQVPKCRDQLDKHESSSGADHRGTGLPPGLEDQAPTQGDTSGQ